LKYISIIRRIALNNNKKVKQNSKQASKNPKKSTNKLRHVISYLIYSTGC